MAEQSDQSPFRYFRVSRLPVGYLGGESYVITAYWKDRMFPPVGEAFVLTAKPEPRMEPRWLDFPIEDWHGDLQALVDQSWVLDHMLEVARALVEEILEERARSLGLVSAGDLPAFDLVPCVGDPLLSCQLRGLYREQIASMAKETRCPELRRRVTMIKQLEPLAKPHFIR